MFYFDGLKIIGLMNLYLIFLLLFFEHQYLSYYPRRYPLYILNLPCIELMAHSIFKLFSEPYLQSWWSPKGFFQIHVQYTDTRLDF